MMVLRIAAVFLLCLGLARAQAGTPTIAAASDLKFALEDMAAAFTRHTGLRVRLAFGSSGNFARQIREGAPFELFLSADESYVRFLEQAGKTVDGGALYSIGRLVLFAPPQSPLRVNEGLNGLRQAIAAGQVRRIAIANPAHAPYGRTAAEALQKAGVWEAVKDKLVLGENVSQAAQFAVTGGVDAAIFAYSLALAPTFAGRGQWALIPEDFHQPLRQRMVLIKGAGTTASGFYRFILGAEGRRILERYGFSLPQD